MYSIRFPTLISTTFVSSSNDVTTGWRSRARNRTKEAFEWGTIAAGCDRTDLQSVYKELCHAELPLEISKRKDRRDDQRAALSIILHRKNVPYDVLIHIVPFTRF